MKDVNPSEKKRKVKPPASVATKKINTAMKERGEGVWPPVTASNDRDRKK